MEELNPPPSTAAHQADQKETTRSPPDAGASARNSTPTSLPNWTDRSESETKATTQGRTGVAPGTNPWAVYGLAARPSWWHYWEERHLPPPAVQEHSDHEDDEKHSGERPPPLPLPGEGAASLEWADYWLRKRLFEDGAPPPPPPPEPREQNFQAPPLRDGDWNRSPQVSKLIAEGFSLNPDVNRRGKAPPRLKVANEEEKLYLEAMLRDGVISRAAPVFSVPHFFLKRGAKLRLIFDGRKLNAASKTPPKFNMKSHKTIAKLTARHSWHAADDLSNMFFSIAIAEKSKPFFGLRTSEGSFCYNKLPFGFSWSPFIAHIAVDQICKRALEEGHAVTHYLDDFHYFADSEDEVLRTRSRVRELFEQAGWKVNLKKAVEPSSSFVALGIAYDAKAKTARVPETSLLALWQVHKSLLRTKTITLRGLQSLLGSLVFFTNAAKGALCLCEKLINLVGDLARRRVKKIEYAKVQGTVSKAIEAFDKLGNFPLHFSRSKPVQIYTDATPGQIAFVAPEQTKARAIARKQIYRAEADAIYWMLSEAELPKDFTIRCDNAALVFAVRKGRSAIREADRVCRRILELRKLGHYVGIKFIPTDLNPADKPSRAALAVAA